MLGVEIFLFLLLCRELVSAKCGQQQGQFANALFSKNTSAVVSKGNSGKISNDIIGGNQAYLGQWPWQALIEFSNSHGQSTLCGGTLISAQHVLTAAHCAVEFENRPSLASVWVGLIDSHRKSPGIFVGVAAVSIHSGYNGNQKEFENDIAVVTLGQAVTFSTTIQPICLPEKDSIPSGDFVVTGWGLYNRTSISKDASQFLLYSPLPNVPLDTCRNLWQSLSADYTTDGFVPMDTQICAGSNGHGTAQGDSGGPLLIKNGDGSWTQVGVTSFGINEDPFYYNQGRAPGIYTRLSAHCDFIKKASDQTATCGANLLTIHKMIGIFLLLLNYENHVTTCGGTLISERHVLTAAHCAVMIQHSLDQARAFVSTIHSKNEDRGISLEIAFVKIHDEYDFRTNRNDIAVLTLAKALSFNPTIQPICFAEKNFEFPSDARFWTAGWGAYNRGKSIVIEASDRLMYTSLPNVNLKECRRLWATLTADHLQGFEPDFDSTQICAGDDGRGTAMGDSGGPLMIEKNGTWIQVGITSFGINNDHTLLYNQKRAPGIYTRVSAYHDFIEKSQLHSMVSSDNSTSTHHIICVGIFSFLVLTFLYLAFYQ
ncbi:unnamed protein product, partial [Mesorhabditis belari]|uniref:Peptidase S1 domain-containing protein n=1 Tax=Mesorhabditis belari TaxID=2138241 RepID=A0AAF3F5G4_9BILA